MNNSKLAIDSVPLNEEKVVDTTPQLREREATLVRTIETLQRVSQSNDWSTLKTELFDDLPKSLRKDILAEGRKDDPSTNKLNRLTGELKWAERFSDLSKLENSLRVELQRVRAQLHGK